MIAKSSIAGLPRTAIVHHRNGIGDLIWHIPYIRAIAARSANGTVTVVARPACRAAEILAAEPTVERVIEFDHRPRSDVRRRGLHDSLTAQIAFARGLRAGRFDRIFIFSSRARYGILALLAGIPHRAGFGFSAFERFFLNLPPYIDRHRGPGNWVYPEATAFAVAHGFVDGPIVPRMALPPHLVATMAQELGHLPRPRYAFAIGASARVRNWGATRFAVLGDALIARGCGVLLLGGHAERDLAAAIVGAIAQGHRAAVQPLTPASTLVSAAALRQCDFCVGNDTGALNMAAANGVPSLGLFGASPPLRHDPILHAVEGHGMAAIDVADVLARLRELAAPGLAPGARAQAVARSDSTPS
jgi:heptosyltransferase-2